MSEAATLLGLLADADRMRVVAALVLDDGSVARVSERTGLPTRAVLRALTRLEAAGLVATDGDRWRFLPQRLAQAARAAAPGADGGDVGATDPRESAVLRAFIRDGRLTSIPAARGKRRIVLDYVARVFEVGVRYPEPEVDVVLRAFHPDHAALRRYLVDEGFLSRDGGAYWRTGGTVAL